MQTKTLLHAIKHPKIFAIKLLQILGPIIPDKPYLILMFRLKMGQKLDLKSPKSYNEKLQWLKLYNRNPEYTRIVDKCEVKEYVSKIIGHEYIIPTYGMWNRPEDIDFSSLPNEFVIKTTQGGGGRGIVICKSKKNLDIAKTRKILEYGMKQNIYNELREWPYKNVVPRVIAEKLLKDDSQEGLDDYKLMCFNGKVKLIEHHTGRFSDHHKQNFYTPSWELTSISQSGYSKREVEAVPKPKELDEMIALSEKLSVGFPHIRIDWYSVKGQLYFGEMTFFDGSGFVKFDDYNDDLKLGSWIDLNNVLKS